MTDNPKIILVGREFEADTWVEGLNNLLQSYFRDHAPLAITIENQLHSGIVFARDVPVGEG